MHALKLPWKRRLRVAYRRLLSGERVLPDFIIIGGMKCGTTSLLHHLNQHPQVAAAAVKEVHFFDTQFSRGADWYRTFFPTKAALEGARQRLGKNVVTGEASPYYIVHPHAPRRIAETIPHVKLIALLRDPVSRAYSHYAHNCRPKHRRKGREPLSFEEALAREEIRTAGEFERMIADEQYDSPAFRHYSYARRGMYLEQLRRYAEHFDRSQILVLKAEDWFQRTQQCYDQALAFLALEPRTIRKPRVRNAGRYADRPEETLARLSDHFDPHNRQLYEYLQRDMDWGAPLNNTCTT